MNNNNKKKNPTFGSYSSSNILICPQTNFKLKVKNSGLLKPNLRKPTPLPLEVRYWSYLLSFDRLEKCTDFPSFASSLGTPSDRFRGGAILFANNCCGRISRRDFCERTSTLFRYRQYRYLPQKGALIL